MDEFLKLAAENGIWAVLAIFMVKWTLDNSKEREKEYQAVIKENQKVILTMTEKLELLNHLKTDMDLILECLACPPKRGDKNGKAV